MTSQTKTSQGRPNGIHRSPADSDIPSKSVQQNLSDSLRQRDKAANNQSRSSPIRRLSKRIRVKLGPRSRYESDGLNDQQLSDATTLVPIIAPAPVPHQDERFAGEAPEAPSFPVKEAITDPLGTLKSLMHKKGGDQFAESLANTGVSHGAGVKFVEAHEQIDAATNDDNRLAAEQEFETLKEERQTSFVRLTMDRHVRKVKNVQSQRRPRPHRDEFVWLDGEARKMHWLDYGHDLFAFYAIQHAGQYIGASSELPEPTESALMSSFERVLLTSMPVQNFFMRLRSIALWEVPRVTSAYAALYFVLCVFDYVPGAFLLLVLCTTLRTRYYPPSIPELREKLERSEDPEKTAQDLTEVVEQHGAHGWMGALIERAGPTMQLQLEDMANFMEVTQNFYEWRDPRRSAVSLAVLFVIWLFVTLAPFWLLVKGFFIAVGIMFFVVTPLSNRWPQYRLFFSPITWLFWKIPTHGEWAIARLQAEAAQFLQDPADAGPDVEQNAGPDKHFIGPLPDPKTTHDSLSTTDGRPKKILNVGRYRCIYKNIHGNLCLDDQGLHFEVKVLGSEKWRLQYANMKSVQKIVGSGKMMSGEDILFTTLDDEEYQVSALKLRDQVFTQIVAYSNIEWQITG